MLPSGSIESMPVQPSVALAIEDESFGAFVAHAVQQMGLHVVSLTGGVRLTGALRDHQPRVLLIDSRLPNIDVRALCAELRIDRQTRSLVILVLLASGDEDRSAAFIASGADECLARPLLPEGLLARVLASLPGAVPGAKVTQILTFQDLEIDLTSYVVRRQGRAIHLGPTEFRLLAHFMKSPGRVHSRSELQLAAWPRDIHLGNRTVDVHVGRLRHALKGTGGTDLIRTVRSIGYALSDEVAGSLPQA